MAILNTTKTTTAYAILRRARAEARIGTDSSSTNFVGSTSTDVDALLLDDANEVERETILEFPGFALTSSALTTVASTRYIALPATILLNQIVRLEWNDSTDMAGVQLTQINETQVDSLVPCYRQSDYTVSYPQFFHMRRTLQSTSNVIDLYPLPDAARAMTLWFLAKGTTFVADDLTNSAGTNYSAVPNEFYELPALKWAYRLSVRNHGYGSDEAQAMRVRYEECKQYHLPHISSTVGQIMNASIDWQGYPRNQDNRIQWDMTVREGY